MVAPPSIARRVEIIPSKSSLSMIPSKPIRPYLRSVSRVYTAADARAERGNVLATCNPIAPRRITLSAFESSTRATYGGKWPPMKSEQRHRRSAIVFS